MNTAPSAFWCKSAAQDIHSFRCIFGQFSSGEYAGECRRKGAQSQLYIWKCGTCSTREAK